MEHQILNVLRQLAQDDFNTVKWFLKKPEQVNGLKGIPKSQLEKATRYNTTDLIMQFYPGNETDIMVDVLKSIDRHDLVEKFKKGLSSAAVVVKTEQTSWLQTLPSPTSSTGPAGTNREQRDDSDEEQCVQAITSLYGAAGTVFGAFKAGPDGAHHGGRLGETIGSTVSGAVIDVCRLFDKK